MSSVAEIVNKKMFTKGNVPQIADKLRSGEIGILPTDTVYGLHCLASDRAAIKRIYEIKQRPENMPYITLISSFADLESFEVVLSAYALSVCNKLWPGPNTLIFSTKSGDKRSFRVPNNKFLLDILRSTGPLVSTSANTHKNPVASTIQDALTLFVDKVDFYVDGGELNNPPSSIYAINDDSVTRIR